VLQRQQGEAGKGMGKVLVRGRGGQVPLYAGEPFYALDDNAGAYDDGELPSSEVEVRDWMQVRAVGGLR
jgi:hypothetical protein